jgi:signal transduction histidine kinase
MTLETASGSPVQNSAAFIHRRMGKTGCPRLGLLLALAFLLVSPLAAPLCAQTAAPKRIVTLYWYGKDFWSNVVFEKAMQDRLRAAPAGSVEYYAEYLENNRFPGEAQARMLRDYLVRKYADRRIDVVVAVGPAALNFLLADRPDLFPDTPIVFHTVTRPEFGDRPPARNVTGVISDDVYRKTLDLALDLHPETERVLVIASSPEGDKRNERLFRRGIAGLKKRVTFTYLSDLPLDQLLAAVKAAHERSLILFLWHSQSEPGTTLEPLDVLGLIERSASVPLYSLATSYVGRGSVGGYTFDTAAAATKVTDLALQIARGARPEDSSIVEISSTPTFDWRQLQRWGISEDRLPAGSVVLFHHPSFFEEYRRYAVGAVLVFALETALIMGLLFQRARRRRAEGAWRASEARYRAIGDALRQSDERIEDLAGRLIVAQEAERKRIARELHDDLSQKLALLSIDIEQLPRRTPAELAEYVRKISDRAAEVATDVHHLAYELHPSKLESLGLVPAVNGLCRDFSRQHDLQVDFEHRHVPQDVPPEIALCLYRIVQEGLHNVVKHSGAHQAWVELVAADGVLDLRIADPGVGFATSMTGRSNIGIGIVGMRERVNIVRGKIVIHTAPGAGTRIGVRVRLDGLRLDAPVQAPARRTA